MDKKTIRELIVYLIFSRILLLIVPLIFKMLLFHDTGFSNLFDFLYSTFVRWDAHHFLYIAENNYVSEGDPSNYIVFQPLYPYLVKAINLFIGNYLISALLISNTCFITASILFYKLLRIDYNQKISVRAVFLISVFPTAYFFSLPYTESLFFLLVVSTFYLIKTDRLYLAGIPAALAVLTRYFGLILAPVLIYEYIIHRKKYQPEDLIIALLPIGIAVLTYLGINKYVMGDYFAFSYILKSHWSKSITFPWEGIRGAWFMAISGFNPQSFMIGFTEFVSAVFVWFLAIISFKKIKRIYAVYTLFATILLTSTGFLLSTPRYYLSIPTLFILLAVLIKNKFSFYSWTFLSIMLLTLLSLLYVSGQWAY